MLLATVLHGCCRRNIKLRGQREKTLTSDPVTGYVEGGDDARLVWCWATPIRAVSGGLFLYCCFLPKCMCAHICTMCVVGTQVEVREQLCRTDSLHRALCGFQKSNFCRQPCIARTPSLVTQSSFWPLCGPFDAKDNWGKFSPPLGVPELKPLCFVQLLWTYWQCVM